MLAHTNSRQWGKLPEHRQHPPMGEVNQDIIQQPINFLHRRELPSAQPPMGDGIRKRPDRRSVAAMLATRTQRTGPD